MESLREELAGQIAREVHQLRKRIPTHREIILKAITVELGERIVGHLGPLLCFQSGVRA